LKSVSSTRDRPLVLYEEKTDLSITKTIARWVSNYENQASVGSRFRAKRIAPLRKLIETVFREHGTVNMIDVGGTEKYWGIVPRQFLIDNKVSITILNLPGQPLTEAHDPFKFVEGDGCDLSMFDDHSFHVAHSNSVLEHVGDWNRMLQFAGEVSRVSERYFVQTPNYWFPIEPHSMTPFFHWLPKPIRIWLVSHFQLGHWEKAASRDDAVRIVESARLLNKKRFQQLFGDAEISTERFLGLPKSFVAIRG
jgi:SAM-dependent methyltransferase